jgi:Cof subfamily protein (haloacid dehalogenase superfamily)
MIKLIATDIDGTLLDANRFISAATKNAFNSYDIPKILISARMPSAMYYLQDELGIRQEPLICYNGALVLDGDEVLYQTGISPEITSALAEIASDNDLHLSLYRNDEWFVPEMDHWAKREVNNTRVQPEIQDSFKTIQYLEKTANAGLPHKIMLMGDPERMETAFAKAQQQLSSKVHLYRSKDSYTEITPKGTSKLHALDLLLGKRFPEVSLENVAAFGDNYNDEEMLAAVGYGVAVENARDVVKKAAKFHTLHHKSDGVANWLSEHKKSG